MTRKARFSLPSAVNNFFTSTLIKQIARKVPEVTVIFWIIKLLSTALGESVSDYLVHHYDPVIAVIGGAIAFTVTILLQLFTRKYKTWIYWLAVVMVAIFGTMAADVVHIVLGVPYLTSTIFFAVALTIIFILWYKIENTLSIHSIITSRRELFYWATVVTTFALGTAAGDMTAITLGWGYLASGILFAALFAIPLVVYKLFGADEVLTFWAAYIVTRPLGASFADWFGKTPDLGGIGFGTGKTSIVLTTLIIIFVGYLAKTHKDIKNQRQHS
ncbi:hypothetical protein M1271_02070 [Patescibacteria group bacterium]|nr:hypothetical protein [Patescibacteria group bacterium]MCL5798327.1 hypothetical protein [Patescibacteria group bacterium]